jgi:hypothetical protein
MNLGKLAIGAVVSTIFIFLLDYVWYMVLMTEDGREPPDFLWLIIGLLIFSVAFVHIYIKGAEAGTPVQQGMRFGIWATLIMWIPMNLLWYAVIKDHPLNVYLVDCAYRLVQMVLLGIIVAYVTGVPGGNRGKASDGGDG